MKIYTYLLLILGIPAAQAYETECKEDQKFIENLLYNNIKHYADRDGATINVEYLINNWEFQHKYKALKIYGTVVTGWQKNALNISQQQACHKTLRLSTSTIGYFPFIDHFGSMNNPTTLQINLDKDGNFQFLTKHEQLLLCETGLDEYPFSNTTCTLELKKIETENGKFSASWGQEGTKLFKAERNLGNFSNLILKEFNVTSSNNEELAITITFSKSIREVLIKYFIPSVVFMIPPLYTLLLGPMVITRCCVIMTSLIVLTIHNKLNGLELPIVEGVNAISVWELFSYIFVVFIFLELVLITLLTSIGRSRVCCTSKFKITKYEIEPLYEEMNDLRERKTRRTKRCCRITALLVDMISFVFFGVVFIIFCYGYYKDRSLLLKIITDFKIELFYFL